MKHNNDEQGLPCAFCLHAAYDDDGESVVCCEDLDEDEMISFLSKKNFDCPYFQINDEYKRVKTQN